MDQNNIRNFCIIAHPGSSRSDIRRLRYGASIDHYDSGKHT